MLDTRRHSQSLPCFQPRGLSHLFDRPFLPPPSSPFSSTPFHDSILLAFLFNPNFQYRAALIVGWACVCSAEEWWGYEVARFKLPSRCASCASSNPLVSALLDGLRWTSSRQVHLVLKHHWPCSNSRLCPNLLPFLSHPIIFAVIRFCTRDSALNYPRYGTVQVCSAQSLTQCVLTWANSSFSRSCWPLSLCSAALRCVQRHSTWVASATGPRIAWLPSKASVPLGQATLSLVPYLKTIRPKPAAVTIPRRTTFTGTFNSLFPPLFSFLPVR